jgi:hypothetical protein
LPVRLQPARDVPGAPATGPPQLAVEIPTVHQDMRVRVGGWFKGLNGLHGHLHFALERRPRSLAHGLLLVQAWSQRQLASQQTVDRLEEAMAWRLSPAWRP